MPLLPGILISIHQNSDSKQATCVPENIHTLDVNFLVQYIN